ncbi:MAG: hypothetical protein ACRDTA_27350 [Pseudonocardiaceae bacterium]
MAQCWGVGLGERVAQRHREVSRVRRRQAAAAEGRTLSAWTERAVRAELMRTSAAIAAEWERATGDSQARTVAELAEQRAMGEAIRSSGQGW